MKDWTKEYKAFIAGMVFGACLMLILLFPSKVQASDANNEAFCLAQNMYFEAGNQPLAGKIAVSQVVINRTQHMNYPTNICGVVYQARWKENWKGNMIPIRNRCQFSWFCDGKSDEPTDSVTWMESIKLAGFILNGTYPDITEGALWYHTTRVDPYWNDYLESTVIINDHIFYK